MGFSIFPGIDKESVHYKFMERGDLVYYVADGRKERVFATVEYFTRNKYGTPEEITLRLLDGTTVNTSIKNIIY